MTPEERLAELYEEKASIEVLVQVTNDNPDLTPEKKQSEVNQLTVKVREVQKAINRATLDVALGGRRKLFDAIRSVQAGLPLSGITIDDLPKLSKLQKEIEATAKKGLAEDIKVSTETVKDFESQIVEIRSRIDEERKHISLMAEEAFTEAPLFIAMQFPQITAVLCGEAQQQNTSPAPVRTGFVSAADNPDQKEMLGHINADTIREAIATGVDAESNADILRWIAKTKLGKEVAINQSLRTKVYHVREALGYVKPRK